MDDLRTSTPEPAAAELACPLCGYDLRGLTDPRCPECGFAFAWAELRDAQRNRHPWLFEHGRGRNVKSFLATYARSAFPRRFWRTVTPANPVHVGRLLLYAAVATLALVIAVAVPVARTAVDLARTDAALRARYSPTPKLPGYVVGPDPSYFLYGQVNGSFGRIPTVTVSATRVDAVVPRVVSAAFAKQVWDAYADDGRYLSGEPLFNPNVVGIGVVLAWPWLTLAGLLAFPASMRRAKVPPGHVLRAVVYGGDLGVPLLLAAAVLFVPTFDAGSAYTYGGSATPRQTIWALLPTGPFDRAAVPALVAVGLCLAVTSYRMSVAYARYLRFDRPVLTVLAAQAMVVLAVAIVVSRTVRVFG